MTIPDDALETDLSADEKHVALLAAQLLSGTTSQHNIRSLAQDRRDLIAAAVDVAFLILAGVRARRRAHSGPKKTS